MQESHSFFNRELLIKNTSCTLHYFISVLEENSLYLEAPYQRDYVWGEEEKQALLESVFNNLPISSVSIAINDISEPEKYCEVVDGKQRITTLLSFFANEFPYMLNGEPYYFKDMSVRDQRSFKHTKLPTNELHSATLKPLTEQQKIKFFLQINFGGAPQSQEHEERVRAMFMSTSIT